MINETVEKVAEQREGVSKKGGGKGRMVFAYANAFPPLFFPSI